MGGRCAAKPCVFSSPSVTAATFLLFLLQPTDASRWDATDTHCTTHPEVIRATNETLTFVADLQYLQNCQQPYLIWQAKSWVEENWSRDNESRDGSPHTFTDLVPGIRYEVRALPYSKGKPCPDCITASAWTYTCSGEVPALEDFYFTEREESHLEFEWTVPEHMCASVSFLIQLDEPYDEDKYMDGCPPPFLASPQPNYTCIDEGNEKMCSARLEGISPLGRYYVGVIGVDWSGNCSHRDWNVSDPEGARKSFVGQWVLLGLTLLGIVAAAPMLFKKYRKRFKFNRSERPRITFTQERSSVDNSAANAANENCDVSYIVPESQTRSGIFLTVPLQT